MDPVPPVPAQPAPQPQSVTPPETPKSKLWLWVVGGILLLGVGTVTGIYLGKQLYSKPALQPSPTPKDIGLMPEPVPFFANWKTYKNDVVGFEFKYPNLWVIEDYSRSSDLKVNLKLTSEDLNSEEVYGGGDWPVPVYIQGGSLSLTVDSNPYYRSVDEFKKAESKNYLKTIKLQFSNEVLYKTKKYSNNYGLSEAQFLMKNTYKLNAPVLFKLTMEYSENEEAKYNNLFNQILSTFKFTN